MAEPIQAYSDGRAIAYTDGRLVKPSCGCCGAPCWAFGPGCTVPKGPFEAAIVATFTVSQTFVMEVSASRQINFHVGPGEWNGVHVERFTSTDDDVSMTGLGGQIGWLDWAIVRSAAVGCPQGAPVWWMAFWLSVTVQVGAAVQVFAASRREGGLYTPYFPINAGGGWSAPCSQGQLVSVQGAGGLFQFNWNGNPCPPSAPPVTDACQFAAAAPDGFCEVGREFAPSIQYFLEGCEGGGDPGAAVDPGVLATVERQSRGGGCVGCGG